MELTTGWTGRTACALQAALRLSNESFAEHRGIGARTIAAWHQKPTLRPKSEIQQLLDTALERASPAAKERFAALVSGATTEPEQAEASADAELRLGADPNIGAALDWLDQHADWKPGTARRQVASRLARLDVRALQDRGSRRGRVNQRRIAQALGEYYRDRTAHHGRYAARCGGDGAALTSVLTCPDWLDLACPLVAAQDRLGVTSAAADADLALDGEAAERAAQRLAETLAMNVRLVDMPLYRLLGINVRHGEIGGSLGVVHFVGYALTMDLLEGELVDALAAKDSPRRGSPSPPSALPDIGTRPGPVCGPGRVPPQAPAPTVVPARDPDAVSAPAPAVQGPPGHLPAPCPILATEAIPQFSGPSTRPTGTVPNKHPQDSRDSSPRELVLWAVGVGIESSGGDAARGTPDGY